MDGASPSDGAAPPALTGSVVPRRALLARLQEASRRRLTLLVAAAGSGKSVALAQLAAGEVQRRVVWLPLIEAEVDADRFLAQLLASLRTSFPSFPVGDLRSEGPEAIGAEGINSLVRCLHELPELLLVIDDLHRLSASLTREVAELIHRAPSHVHFVVATRVDPSGALTRLELAGEVSHFGQGDLALSASEERAIVERVAGVSLDPGQLRALHRRTEGWAAATQVAAVTLRAGVDVDVFLEDYGGADRRLSSYLREELLDSQPPDLRDFMLRTSVVDELGASLAEALTGRVDSQAVLEELERRSLLLTSVDGRRKRFRYHHLLAEMLRYELSSVDAKRARELTRVAADWHIDRGDLFTAGDLLFRIEAWEELLALIFQRSWSLYEQTAAFTSTLRWTRGLPPALLHENQRGLLMLAAQARALGNSATCDALLRELESSGFSDGHVEATARMLRCAGVQYEEPLEDVGVNARAVREWTESDPPPPEGLHCSSLENPTFLEMEVDLAEGRAEAYMDRPKRARELLLRASEGHAYWAARVGALGSLAHLEARCGNLHRAMGWATESLDFAQEHSLDEHLACIDAQLTCAMLARERDDLAGAVKMLDEAGARAASGRRTAMVAMHLAERCLLAIGSGEHAEALGAAETFRQTSPRQPVPAVAARLLAAEARLLVASGDPDQAKRLLGLAAPTLDALSAGAALALSLHDVSRARPVLQAWPALETVRSKLERLIWTAALADQLGEPEASSKRMADALHLGEHQGHLRTFLDAGAHVMSLVERCAEADPTSYAATVLAARIDERPKALLSERELAVLRWLATTESNRVIAERLFISSNTLKTHLRRIYRKLGVANRLEAVHTGLSQGLIPPTRWPE